MTADVLLYVGEALGKYGFPNGHPFGPDRQDPLEGIPRGGRLVIRDTAVQTETTQAVEGARHEVQLRPVDVRRQQTDPGGRPSFREGPRYDTVSRVDPTPAMRTREDFNRSWASRPHPPRAICRAYRVTSAGLKFELIIPPRRQACAGSVGSPSLKLNSPSPPPPSFYRRCPTATLISWEGRL